MTIALDEKEAMNPSPSLVLIALRHFSMAVGRLDRRDMVVDCGRRDVS